MIVQSKSKARVPVSAWIVGMDRREGGGEQKELLSHDHPKEAGRGAGVRDDLVPQSAVVASARKSITKLPSPMFIHKQVRPIRWRCPRSARSAARRKSASAR